MTKHPELRKMWCLQGSTVFREAKRQKQKTNKQNRRKKPKKS